MGTDLVQGVTYPRLGEEQHRHNN